MLIHLNIKSYFLNENIVFLKLLYPLYTNLTETFLFKN